MPAFLNGKGKRGKRAWKMRAGAQKRARALFGALTRCTASAIHDQMPITLKLAAFRLEQDILDGMEALRTRDGIPASEQVRRALRAYLKSKGVRLAVRQPRQNERKRHDDERNSTRRKGGD